MKRSFPLVVLLIACSSSDTTLPLQDAFTIEPTEAVYSPGATVSVLLRNVGERDLNYSACGASLETIEGDKWVSAPVDGTNCADVLYTIAAGATISIQISPALPATLANGTYRYILSFLGTAVDGNRPASDRTSFPFRVTG